MSVPSGNYVQRQLPALVSEPVEWLFFPPKSSFPLRPETGVVWIQFRPVERLILTLYVDGTPGADAGTLKNSVTAEETSIQSLTEYEDVKEGGYRFLFLSGEGSNGAAVNIIVSFASSYFG